MKNPFLDLVERYRALLDEARSVALGEFSPPNRPPLPAGRPNVLLFSPHPDDECIIGGLPLHLLREEQMNVINAAVTLGSQEDRRQSRWEELQTACRCLGFQALTLQDGGLENITRKSHREQPQSWGRAVELAANQLRALQPRIIFLPHSRDRNKTHMGTHDLVIEAIRDVGNDLSGSYIVETEYWSTMDRPNLLVESSAQDVADLLFALACHVGEVQRNPHYLTLPAWMQDNVRRGIEIVGGQGAAAPGFDFGTLYRVLVWNGRRMKNAYPGGKILSCGELPRCLFPQ